MDMNKQAEELCEMLKRQSAIQALFKSDLNILEIPKK